jgi:putative ABC transport system permease protein
LKKPFLAPPGLWRVGWRYLLIHRWQSLLMVLGIALGVAVVVSIDLANASANQAFELSSEAVTGRATHQISGGPDGLDENIYTHLRLSGRQILAAPVITAYVSSPQLGNQPLQLLGVDLFADPPFRNYLDGLSPGESQGLTVFLTQPGALLLSANVAQRYGLRVGDHFILDTGGKFKPVLVAGVLDPSDDLARHTLEGVLLADIATAQELIGRMGKIDRIDLILPEKSSNVVREIHNMLPGNVRLGEVEARRGSIAQMSAAFRLNLSALSLLALLVGLFLIYNTMTFSVVQRRALFGGLRCLGVTRREIFQIVLGEAFIVGITGSVAGILFGMLLGRQTVHMVTQTINDLYFTTTVGAVGIPPGSLLKGGLMGVIATVITAVFPAYEASTVEPRAALLRSGLESKARRLVMVSSLAGALLIGTGVLVFTLPGNGLISGFSGTFIVVVGFAMLATLTIVGLMHLAAPLLGWLFGFLGRMAPRSLVNSLSRTAIAVAALMVAVAVAIGVNLMIASFRYTVEIWLGAMLHGDIYISAPLLTATAPSQPIDPRVVERARQWQGVTQVEVLRTVLADSPYGAISLSGSSNPNIASERLFLRLDGNPNEVWQAMEQQDAVLISETLARRAGLLEPGGGRLVLQTPAGERSFLVAGVYYDYAASQGAALIAMDTYRRLWQDDAVTAVDVRLAPGQNTEAVATEMRDALNIGQHVLVRSNAALRAAVMEVFDRTFAITTALSILTTVVAFIGVFNTLMLLQLEKQREIGFLRAMGLTGTQLWRLVMLETGLMGLSAGLLAVPTGYALALILIYVINQRSFGWTLQLDLQPAIFLQAMAIAVCAALLAGIYPAWRIGRTQTAEVIRYE